MPITNIQFNEWVSACAQHPNIATVLATIRQPNTGLMTVANKFDWYVPLGLIGYMGRYPTVLGYSIPTGLHLNLSHPVPVYFWRSNSESWWRAGTGMRGGPHLLDRTTNHLKGKEEVPWGKASYIHGTRVDPIINARLNALHHEDRPHGPDPLHITEWDIADDAVWSALETIRDRYYDTIKSRQVLTLALKGTLSTFAQNAIFQGDTHLRKVARNSHYARHDIKDSIDLWTALRINNYDDYQSAGTYLHNILADRICWFEYLIPTSPAGLAFQILISVSTTATPRALSFAPKHNTDCNRDVDVRTVWVDNVRLVNDTAYHGAPAHIIEDLTFIAQKPMDYTAQTEGVKHRQDEKLHSEKYTDLTQHNEKISGVVRDFKQINGFVSVRGDQDLEDAQSAIQKDSALRKRQLNNRSYSGRRRNALYDYLAANRQ